MTLLQRYRNGEHKTVWDEMASGIDKFGNSISQEDAEAVATETMQRVRRNIETIIERLIDTGYEFGITFNGEENRYAEPFRSEPDNAEQNIAYLESTFGELPLSLKMFWRVVGAVCLVGRYPDWAETVDETSIDALWITPADSGEFELYEQEDGEEFVLPLAPDQFAKAVVSGGAPYGIALPCATTDAIFTDWHGTTFVNYLRICFEWGGFPGFAREWNGEKWVPQSIGTKKPQEVPAQIAMLREGLLPI